MFSLFNAQPSYTLETSSTKIHRVAACFRAVYETGCSQVYQEAPTEADIA